MIGFLAQLGKNLADRWVTLLVLPGLLFTAAAVSAYHLGQSRPLDPRPLTSWLDRLTATSGAHRDSTVILAVTVALLASATAGLAAEGLAAALERLWTAPGTRPPMSWIQRARRSRWAALSRREPHLRETARQKAAEANDPGLTGRALTRARTAERRAKRHHLAALRQPPERPTRVAERFHASVARAGSLYDLDLNLVWPRLWTVLPDTLRTDITAARDAYASATRLAAWALMYTLIATLWWPAALLGAVIGTTALVKIRTAANVLAELIDTAVDLHLTDLAERLHVTTEKPPTPDTGRQILRRLNHPAQPSAPMQTPANPQPPTQAATTTNP